jgi:cytochrome c-type biogenesis protein CcmF
MLADIGIAALFLAFIAAALGTFLALYGIFTRSSAAIQSARNAFLISLPMITGVAAVLIYAQMTGEYQIAYVSHVSKDAQPDLLKFTALWGGQAGSLILWTWMLNLFLVAALLLNWKSEHQLMPWVMVFAGVTLAFFLVLNNFYENPFSRYWALENGNVKEAVLKPDGAVPAYPYQTSQGETFHVVKDGFIQGMPDARYDGRGLNPLLRHPGMVIHPPMLYLGFTGFIIPFAFAMAALATGELGAGWIRSTRRWSLVAWMFLSLGLILGGRWAYDVLGWGGYWGWDPVENSSLLPWLTGTAFLHSVMIQERRGMLKGWNMAMIMLTYLLVLFGTVATRTGLLSSVHTFAQSPLSIPMGIFLTLTTLVCVGMFIWRGSQGKFQNDHALEGLLSRESLFLFNNWVFLALTVVVFWGTWSELITGFARDAGLMQRTITFGPEYYEMITPWLFGILFILMGVAPLAAWRRASAQKLGKSVRVPIALTAILSVILLVMGIGALTTLAVGLVAFAGFATLVEFYKGVSARHQAHRENWLVALSRLFARNRRRYGGYTIHLGVVVIGIGIIGSTAFQEVRQMTLSPGDTLDIGPYTLQYNRLVEAKAVDSRDMMIAEVTLYRDGRKVDDLRPRQDFFDPRQNPMTIAGQHSTIENDVYALLTFWENDRVTLRVYRNPLVNFVWWGGLILIIGTVVAVWPDPEPETVRKVQAMRRSAYASAGD